MMIIVTVCSVRLIFSANTFNKLRTIFGFIIRGPYVKAEGVLEKSDGRKNVTVRVY